MGNKNISTLVEDIQSLLTNGVSIVDDKLLEKFSQGLSKTMVDRVLSSERKDATLRMSNIGKPCLRQLWYEINLSEKKEELDASTKMKFGFGDIIEEYILFLAELSGHRVEGRQDTLTINGIHGHRDAVIDGVVVDVKSASTYSFNKFRNHLSSEGDSFGYIPQLQSYLHAAQTDDIVTDKSRGAFLVVDKTLGHLHLDFHKYIPFDWENYYERKKEAVRRDNPPLRHFSDIPEGKSGNRKLAVNCSYCPFKHECWPDLRTFIYSTGPVFLTRVVREPNVQEVAL